MLAISQLSHFYLAQYGQYFPPFSSFTFIYFYLSFKSAKYEKLGKYWPYCTGNRAITNAYSYLRVSFLTGNNYSTREKGQAVDLDVLLFCNMSQAESPEGRARISRNIESFVIETFPRSTSETNVSNQLQVDRKNTPLTFV